MNVDAVKELYLKPCDICRFASGRKDYDELFGNTMQKSNITVHYFCLLLSTNLPQNGEDKSGINGFLIHDIRREIAKSAKRLCEYCDRIGASIKCQKCEIYFHLKCGRRSDCLFQFIGEFKSYCETCLPLNKKQLEMKENWKINRCHICTYLMPKDYIPTKCLYGPCCGKGFVDETCLQRYALSAGYYLRCLWCRSESFRESIKMLGIFVPDREATWEIKRAFADLHRGHRHCDMEVCHQINGRQFSSKTWKLINCSMCGSFGVHYPGCLPRVESGEICHEKEFKCATCAKIERKQEGYVDQDHDSLTDTSLYVTKDCTIIENKETKESESLSPSKEHLPSNDDEEVELLPQTSQIICNEIETNNNLTPSLATLQANLENDGKEKIAEIDLAASLMNENNNVEALINREEDIPPCSNKEIELYKKIISSSISNRNKNVMLKNLPQDSEVIEDSSYIDLTTDDEEIFANIEHDEKENQDISNVESLGKNKKTDCDSVLSNLSSSKISSAKLKGDDFVEFEAFEFTLDGKVLGSSKLRLDMNNPRFVGKSIEEICFTPGLLSETDVLERTEDIGIFKEVAVDELFTKEQLGHIFPNLKKKTLSSQ